MRDIYFFEKREVHGRAVVLGKHGTRFVTWYQPRVDELIHPHEFENLNEAIHDYEERITCLEDKGGEPC